MRAGSRPSRARSTGASARSLSIVRLQACVTAVMCNFVWSSHAAGLATAPSASGQACESEMLAASRKYAIPVNILYAVGLTETGNRGSLQPYAMNIDGKAVFSPDMATAMVRFEAAKRVGARFIDIGCMQINHRFHSQHFPSLAAMFAPRQNVDYAARFLQTLKAREGSWTMAVARYNAGPDNNPAQKRYVCAVIANMVASGFGSWTPAARNFCGRPGQ